MSPTHHPFLRSDVLGQLSLDVRRWHTGGLGESKAEIRPPGNGSPYEGMDDGVHVPHIKRSFLAGAEAFVRPWIDS